MRIELLIDRILDPQEHVAVHVYVCANGTKLTHMYALQAARIRL